MSSKAFIAARTPGSWRYGLIFVKHRPQLSLIAAPWKVTFNFAASVAIALADILSRFALPTRSANFSAKSKKESEWPSLWAKSSSEYERLSSTTCFRVAPFRTRMGRLRAASNNLVTWPPKAGFRKASSICEYHPATTARQPKTGKLLKVFFKASAVE